MALILAVLLFVGMLPTDVLALEEDPASKEEITALDKNPPEPEESVPPEPEESVPPEPEESAEPLRKLESEALESAALEVVRPAVSGVARAQGVTVTVTAPAGAFPAGTTLEITPLTQLYSRSGGSMGQVRNAVAEALADSPAEPRDAAAFDISFQDVYGSELQPGEGYSVSVVFDVEGDSGLAGGDQLQVFHMETLESEAVPIGAPQDVRRGAEVQTVAVEVGAFSIYVVGALGSAGDKKPLSDQVMAVGDILYVYSGKANPARKYEWRSSDHQVVLVTPYGENNRYATLEAISNGVATVSVHYGAGEDAAAIRVGGVAEAVVTQAETAGRFVKLKAALTGAGDMDSVAWSVSDETLAAIDGEGVLTWKKDAPDGSTVTVTAAVGYSGGTAVGVLSLTYRAYTVTYDPSGGSAAPIDKGTYPAGERARVLEPGGMDKEGCVFLGWSRAAPNGTDQAADYQPGDTFQMEGNVTLYAVWRQAASCSLTVDKDFSGLPQGVCPAYVTLCVTGPEGYVRQLRLDGQAEGEETAPWTATLTGLSAGTYVVQETGAAEVAGYQCATEGQAHQVVLSPDSPDGQRIALLNEYTKLRPVLSIDVKLAGLPESYRGDLPAYVILVNGAPLWTGSFAYTAGQGWVSRIKTSVPYSQPVTLSERLVGEDQNSLVDIPGYLFKGVTYSEDSLTLTEDGAVTITNTYARQDGLTINASVERAAHSQEPPAGTVFTYRVEFGGRLYSGPYTVEGETRTAEQGLLRLRGGQSAVIHGVGMGERYSVTGLDLPASYTCLDREQSGVVNHGAQVRFINTYFVSVPTGFTVHKVWDHGGGGYQNPEELRPEGEIAVLLQRRADGEGWENVEGGPRTTSGQKAVWEDLPAYRDAATPYQYRAVETGNVPFYRPEDQGVSVWRQENGRNEITNVFTPMVREENGDAGFSIRLVDGVDTALGLDGAVFGLFTDRACGRPLTRDGVSVVSTAEAGGAAGVYRIAIPGGALEGGKAVYYLKETAAPAGYGLDETVFTVTASKVDENGEARVEVVPPQAGNVFITRFHWFLELAEGAQEEGEAIGPDGVFVVQRVGTRGSLTLHKETVLSDGGPFSAKGKSTFQVTDDGGRPAGRLTLSAGEEGVLPLSAGTYTVRETGWAEFPGYTRQRMSLRPTGADSDGPETFAVTIDAGHRTAALTATTYYTRDTGLLTIEKRIPAEDWGAVPDSYHATVNYGGGWVRFEKRHFGAGPVDGYYVAAKGVVLPTGIYPLSEGGGGIAHHTCAASVNGTALAGEGVPVALEADGATATVVNDYSIHTYSLTIRASEVYDVATSQPPDGGGRFFFTLTFGGGTSVQSGGVWTADGLYRFSLSGGESWTVTGVPYGAGYTLTESAVEGYTSSLPGNAADGVMGERDGLVSVVHTYFHPLETEVTGGMDWRDSGGTAKTDGLPQSATVELWKNGAPTGETRRVTGAEGWAFTFGGLPRYDSSGQREANRYTVTTGRLEGTAAERGRFVAYGPHTAADGGREVLGCWSAEQGGAGNGYRLLHTWTAARDSGYGAFSVETADAVSGRPVKGALFTLSGADGDRSAATDPAGGLRFDGLAPGTYALTEIPPEGYRAAGPWRLRVDGGKDGGILVGVTAPVNGNRFENLWSWAVEDVSGGTSLGAEGALEVTNTPVLTSVSVEAAYKPYTADMDVDRTDWGGRAYFTGLAPHTGHVPLLLRVTLLGRSGASLKDYTGALSGGAALTPLGGPVPDAVPDSGRVILYYTADIPVETVEKVYTAAAAVGGLRGFATVTVGKEDYRDLKITVCHWLQRDYGVYGRERGYRQAGQAEVVALAPGETLQSAHLLRPPAGYMPSGVNAPAPEQLTYRQAYGADGTDGARRVDLYYDRVMPVTAVAIRIDWDHGTAPYENPVVLRPGRVTVELQRSADGGGRWTTVDGSTQAVPTAGAEADWAAWTGLDRYVTGTDTPILYRAAVTAIGGQALDGESGMAGPYLSARYGGDGGRIVNRFQPEHASKNAPVRLILDVRDAVDRETCLSGAGFTLYSDRACTTPLSYQGRSLTSTADERRQGRYTLTLPGELLPGGEAVFYLKETDTPAGYRASGSIVTVSAAKTRYGQVNVTVEPPASGSVFTCVYHWFVSLSGGEGGYEPGEARLSLYAERVTERVYTDAAVSLAVTDGMGLVTAAQAVFALSGTDYTAATVDGVAVFTFGEGKLPAGLYAIRQTEVPEGYRGFNGVVAYVKVTATPESGWTGAPEGLVYRTVVAYQAELYCDKGCTLPAPLEGGRLSVVNEALSGLWVEKVWRDASGAGMSAAPTGAVAGFELYRRTTGERAYQPTGKRITLDGVPDGRGEERPWTAAWTGLDPAWTYTARETGGWSGYTAAGGGWAEEGIITNVRDSSSLTLTKEVAGGPAFAATEKEYVFTLTGPQDVSGSFFAGGGREPVVFTEGVAQLTLNGVESLTVHGLPTGTYRVEEGDARISGYVWSAPDPVTVRVRADRPARARLRNSYVPAPDGPVGSVTITRTVVDSRGGDLGALAAGQISVFSVTGTDHNGVTVERRGYTTGAGSAVVELPYGRYRVEEMTGERAAPELEGYARREVSYRGADFILDAGAPGAAVAAVDTYEPLETRLPVIKTWSGAYGTLPAGIELALYVDGGDTGLRLNLSGEHAESGGRWVGAFTGTPDRPIYLRANGGGTIRYTVRELRIGGEAVAGGVCGSWRISTGVSTLRAEGLETAGGEGGILSGAPVLTVDNRYTDSGLEPGGGGEGGTGEARGQTGGSGEDRGEPRENEPLTPFPAPGSERPWATPEPPVKRSVPTRIPPVEVAERPIPLAALPSGGPSDPAGTVDTAPVANPPQTGAPACLTASDFVLLALVLAAAGLAFAAGRGKRKGGE